MIYTISNGIISVSVNSLGAELNSVIFNGKEKIWQNDNGTWDGHAPILFPVCGHCGLMVYGKSYPIKPHGFAGTVNFAITEKTDTLLRLSVASSRETKKSFPFDFIFDVIYEIKDNVLSVSYEINNISENEYLYFSCGGHESFNVSEPLENYNIIFDKKEKFINLLHNDDGYLTGEENFLEEGNIIDFNKYKLLNDKTLIFKNINSRKVVLAHKSGEKLAEVTFEGFNNLLFWRPKDSKVVCIEPWLNLPDTENTPDTEFCDKYGVVGISPRNKSVYKRTIKYL